MMFPCIRGGDRRMFSMKFLGFASSFDQATQFSFLPPRVTQTQGGAGDLYGPGSVASLPDTKYHLQQTSWDLSVWVPKMVPFNGWKKSASLSKFNWHPRKEGANDGSRNWPWKQAICPPNSCWNWRVNGHFWSGKSKHMYRPRFWDYEKNTSFAIQRGCACNGSHVGLTLLIFWLLHMWVQLSKRKNLECSSLWQVAPAPQKRPKKNVFPVHP